MTLTVNSEALNIDDNNLPSFVDKVITHPYGKQYTLKQEIGSGDFKKINFPNGIYLYSSNYILNKDFSLELSVPKDDYLALHFNQIQAGMELSISLNGEEENFDDKIVTSVFLTAGHEQFILSGTAGAVINRLKLMIPICWMTKSFAFFDAETLNRYLKMGRERLYFDSMDASYRSLVDILMNTRDEVRYLETAFKILPLTTEIFLKRTASKLQKNNQEG